MGMRINYDDDRNHDDYYDSDLGGCDGCWDYKYGNSNENYDMHSMHNMYCIACMMNMMYDECMMSMKSMSMGIVKVLWKDGLGSHH